MAPRGACQSTVAINNYRRARAAGLRAEQDRPPTILCVVVEPEVHASVPADRRAGMPVRPTTKVVKSHRKSGVRVRPQGRLARAAEAAAATAAKRGRSRGPGPEAPGQGPGGGNGGGGAGGGTAAKVLSAIWETILDIGGTIDIGPLIIIRRPGGQNPWDPPVTA